MADEQIPVGQATLEEAQSLANEIALLPTNWIVFG